MESLSNYQAVYKDFKQALDAEMLRAAESFVRIGFLLNFAAETNIVEEGGYANVNEFAKAEYNIDETQVSRFVNIYKEFGVDGEPKLKDQYSNHGVAKLGLMLTLPWYINEEITEDYSKREITAIKREVEEEAKISDIEVMLEEKSTLQQLLPEGLKQLTMQFVKDYPTVYEELYNAVELEDVKIIMAPNEVATYTVRIPAVGKILLFVKVNENIVATNVRNGEKNMYEWEEFFNAVKDYFILGTDAKNSWCNIFQEPWPIEEKKTEEKPFKNAANLHKDNVQKAKPKKESKVKTPEPKNVIKTEETVRKTVENVTESAENMSKEVKTVSNSDEQLPGQDNIMNHPEYLPDEMKEDKKELLTGEVEDIENTDCDNVQQAQEGMKVEHFAPVQNNDAANVIRGYKAGIRAALTIMENKYEQGDWSSLYTNASNIAFRAKKLMELEEKK